MRKYRRFVGNPKECGALFFSFSLDYGARQRNFPEDCGDGFDPNYPPMKRSPDGGFTVLSRNDAGFALILSETA